MFEYDPVKSETSLSKHGVDFKDAQFLWEDPDRIVILLDQRMSPDFAYC